MVIKASDVCIKELSFTVNVVTNANESSAVYTLRELVLPAVLAERELRGPAEMHVLRRDSYAVIKTNSVLKYLFYRSAMSSRIKVEWHLECCRGVSGIRIRPLRLRGWIIDIIPHSLVHMSKNRLFRSALVIISQELEFHNGKVYTYQGQEIQRIEVQDYPKRKQGGMRKSPVGCTIQREQCLELVAVPKQIARPEPAYVAKVGQTESGLQAQAIKQWQKRQRRAVKQRQKRERDKVNWKFPYKPVYFGGWHDHLFRVFSTWRRGIQEGEKFGEPPTVPQHCVLAYPVSSNERIWVSLVSLYWTIFLITAEVSTVDLTWPIAKKKCRVKVGLIWMYPGAGPLVLEALANIKFKVIIVVPVSDVRFVDFRYRDKTEF